MSASPAGLPAVLVQAFSDTPLAGNGAAVVQLAEPASASWMQSIAALLKQSETAYLLPWQGQWALRWFTPSCEVALCGHATLAAVLALGHWGLLDPGQPLRLLSRSGPLLVERMAGEGGAGMLELPSGPLVRAEPAPALRQLLHRKLGEQPEAFWESQLGYRVALLSASAPLAALTGLADALEGAERQGLVLMQAMPLHSRIRVQGSTPHYQLRFFAPGLGLDEDPVTGSAHALVAPYWQRRLNRSAVVGWQCSANGGGMVCEAGSSGMIRLRGSGHLLWTGILDAGADGGCRADWRAWLSGA